MDVARRWHAPPRAHRAPLCPAEPTITHGILGALKGEMPELLSVLFCCVECFFPSSLSDSVEGLDRNHDDDDCNNDGGELPNTGYDVPGTILNALHLNNP